MTIETGADGDNKNQPSNAYNKQANDLFALQRKQRTPEAAGSGVSQDEDKDKAVEGAGTEDIGGKAAESTGEGGKINDDDEFLRLPKKHKIKVDGEESDVDTDRVIQEGIRALQKESAADKRLEEANKLVAESRELATKARETNDLNNNNDKKLDNKQDSAINDDTESISKALAYGDDEERTAAVSKIMGAAISQNPNASTEDISVMVQDAVAFESAKSLLTRPVDQGGFSDVYGDDETKQLFINEEARLSKERPELSYIERFNEAAGVIRKLTKTPDKPTPKDVDEGPNDKQRLKDDLGSPLPVSVAAASVPGSTYKPKTDKQKAAEMKRSRGILY